MEKIRKAKTILVYGGAFDPLTAAHEAVIRDLFMRTVMDQMKYTDGTPGAIVILVSDNDEKKYTAPIENRIRMAELAVESILNWPVYSHLRDYVKVVRQPHRMYQTLTEDLSLPPEKTTVVVGADEWRQLYHYRNWHNWKALLDEYAFLVYSRKTSGELKADSGLDGKCVATVTIGGKETIVLDADAKPYPKDKVRLGISRTVIPPVASSTVRRVMRFNPMYDGTDVPSYIREYISANGLYDQVDQYKYEAYEGEALKRYDPDKYPKCSVTATTVICCDKKVLLVRRKFGPFKGYWCFPGGFANPHETIEEVGLREVREEAGIGGFPGQVHQLGVYTPDDPRNTVKEDHWSYDVGLAVGLDQLPQVSAGDDAKEAEWVPMDEAMNMKLAFHHNRILKDFKKKYPNGLGGQFGVQVISL